LGSIDCRAKYFDAASSEATPANNGQGGAGVRLVGRDLSLHALDKYTALKTTWIAL
jgi:hypothetical protein